jgi:hypothetical protein
MSAPIRRPATAGAPASAASTPSPVSAARADQRWVPWLRLAAFFGLAAFAAGHWATLVEGPSKGRTLLVVLVAHPAWILHAAPRPRGSPR